MMKYERNRMERSNSTYSILLGDIDHFKNVNDNYGHDCGDQVLKTVAAMILTTIRKTDITCRWGGEEFLIVLPDTEKEGALVLGEKLRKKIENQAFTYNDISFNLTISLGLESCSLLHELEHYIAEADKKLYVAKESGRNCVIS